GLHDPPEAHRMTLCHVRALDQDAVSVLQILLKGGGAAAAERDPQTGDRGRVSYASLILDLDDAQPGEELLDEIVLLVVQGSAAQVGHGQGAAHAPAVVELLLPVSVAGALHSIGHHVHGLLERDALPLP